MHHSKLSLLTVDPSWKGGVIRSVIIVMMVVATVKGERQC